MRSAVHFHWVEAAYLGLERIVGQNVTGRLDVPECPLKPGDPDVRPIPRELDEERDYDPTITSEAIAA